MVPPEYRNNPPQESLPLVDKIGNPQNSSELKSAHLDILKPHANALLGLAPLDAPTNGAHPSSLPPDGGQIRANRREQFELTGYIPPIVGGAEQKQEPAGKEYENEAYIKAKLQKVRAWHAALKRQGISPVDISVEDAYKKLEEIETETAAEFGLPWPPLPSTSDS